MKTAGVSRNTRFVGIGVCCVLAAALWAGRSEAQSSLAGTWRGDLNTPAGALTLVLSLDGSSGGTIAVPARGVAGIPVTDVTIREDGSLEFQVPADLSAFEGQLRGSTLIIGEWIQAGQRIPIQFERTSETLAQPVVRPRHQTPKPPHPYAVQEVVVAGEVPLACTLTRPHGSEYPVAGAVLLTVAGPNDRDQTHSGHKPYMVLADNLTRRGLAVLRCDDRGVGGSGDELLPTPIEGMVADARAMAEYLADLDGIGPVGIIGNSEGSVVGAIAAANGDAAFVVLLGGVGTRGDDVIRERLLDMASRSGLSEDEADTLIAPFDALVSVVLEAGGVGASELERTDPALYARLADIAATPGVADPFLPADVEDRIALFAGSWYHAQVSLDGGAILAQVQVPVLALTGSKDRTNLASQNLPAIRSALVRARNPDFEVIEVPGLNHVFQTAVEGGIAEYGQLDESFSPIALQLIGDWIIERFGDE